MLCLVLSPNVFLGYLSVLSFLAIGVCYVFGLLHTFIFLECVGLGWVGLGWVGLSFDL